MWHCVRLDPDLGAIRAGDAGDDTPLGLSASDRRQHRMQVLGVRPPSGIGAKPAGARSQRADQLTLGLEAEDLERGGVGADDPPVFVVGNDRARQLVEPRVRCPAGVIHHAS